MCLIMNPFKTMIITGWFSYPVKDSAVVVGYPAKIVNITCLYGI